MKKIILLLIPFILTGCTVNYELEIKDDLTLKEEFKVLNNESYFNKEGEAEDRYKYIVDLGMKQTNYNDYDYLKENDLYGVAITKNYVSLNDFKQNANSYKEMYEDIQIIQQENIITMKTVGKFDITRIVAISNQEGLDQSFPKDVYFSIKLPFKVLEHNADKIDTINNIYFWTVDESTDDNKSMLIKFDTNKKHFNIIKILKETDYTIPVIIAIIMFVMIFISSTIKKSEKNNRI